MVKMNEWERSRWAGTPVTYHIVREEVDITTDLLLAQATKQTIADRRQRIEELESGAERQHASSKADDIWVAGVQARDVVAENAEQQHVQDSERGTDDERHASRNAGSVRQSSADKICHACAGCDAERERQLVGQNTQALQDGVGGKMFCADATRAQSQDLECEEFGDHHDQTG